MDVAQRFRNTAAAVGTVFGTDRWELAADRAAFEAEKKAKEKEKLKIQAANGLSDVV